MAIIPANTDYTDRDFDSIRARLEQLIRSSFPDWTEFEVANYGNIILDLLSHLGDVKAFYLNNQGRESKIALAQQRKNIIALAKLVGFTPTNNVAATADVIVSLAASPLDDFNLPVGTIVRTKQITDPVEFQFLSPLLISAGQSPSTAALTVENSATSTEAFTSDSLPNQEFELTDTPFVDNSAGIVAGNGAYTKVSNFLNSASGDRHFTTVVDQNDRATIRFGDGVNGEIPTGTITVTYKTGGGIVGNVEAGDIDTIEGSFSDDSGNPVAVTVTNVVKASGGLNRHTVNQIRSLAPESVRTQNRTVSREDYEINAKKLPQIARALMLGSDDDPSLAENTGTLFIIPQGEPPSVPSQALKDAALGQVTSVFPNTITFTVSVLDPVYLDVNIFARVFKAAGATQATVRADIETALASHFALFDSESKVNENVDFGFNLKDVNGNPTDELSWSVIQNAVSDATSVRKMGEPSEFTLNGVNSDIPVTIRQFPRLGTITLTDGDTGESF